MKRLVCLVLCLALALMCATISANAETPSPAGKYFHYGFTAEGYGDFHHFFHFYEEVPVLGSVFYAGFTNNASVFAGTYKVLDEPCAYSVYENRQAIEAGAAQIEGTAPYTIVFYDFAGGELDRCGYDGEKLFYDCDVINGTSCGPTYYYEDRELKYKAAAYDNEVGVTYLSFVADDDDTCTVQLSHNMTYVDLMLFIVEGGWTMIEREDGGYDYALTPDSPYDPAATLSVSADRKTAAYIDDMGEQYAMTNVDELGAKLVYVGSADVEIAAFATTATVSLEMYDDNSCLVFLDIFGNHSKVDQGTYTMNADYSIDFKFETAGALKASVDMSTFSLVLPYKANLEGMGEVAVDLSIVEPAADAPAAQIVLTLNGGYTTLDLYDDGTYAFNFASYNITENGTWKIENYQFSLTQSNGTVILGSLDPTSYALTIEYTAEINEALKDSYTCDAQTWGSLM